MGVVATLAGVLAVFFPETLGEKLPETIQDAVRYKFKLMIKYEAASVLSIKKFLEEHVQAQVKSKLNSRLLNHCY